jgi:hypothetical protein
MWTEKLNFVSDLITQITTSHWIINVLFCVFKCTVSGLKMLRSDDVASYWGEYAVFSSNNVLLTGSAHKIFKLFFFLYKELAMQFANPVI